MFLCCSEEKKNDKYAIQIFQAASMLSEPNKDKSVTLRGYSRQPKSRVIDRMGKRSHHQQGQLQKILTHIKTQNQDFQSFAVKKILKSQYQSLVDEYAHTNKKWTDPDFPPQQRSFGVGRQTEKVVWQRVEKAIKQQPVFIGGGSIQPHDILQGKIGDCYFLSAISGLAEKDHRIKAIFPNLQINKNGIYMARILHKGVFQQVIVDDYFPVSKYDQRLMTANPSKGEEIWVMILEKCWAKLFGSYQAIDGGLPKDVLHAFSAAPIYEYLTDGDSQENNELFRLMMEAEQREYVVCCGTYSRQDVEQVGLVPGHAYTVLGVYDKPRKLLKLRNPWGQLEWKGGASDKDKKFWNSISASEKRRLGYQDKNDGLFFMFWEEFPQYFQLVDICKIDDHANYYYEEITYPNGKPVYTALESKGGQATIAITQESTRGQEVPEPRYASATFLIGQKIQTRKGIDYKYVNSLSMRNHCNVNLQVDLEDGQYIVCSILKGRNPSEDATLSCYCRNPVQLEQSPKINEEEFLHRMFLDHARQNTQNQQMILGNGDVWVCMDIIYESGFAYTAVHIGASARGVKLGLTFNEEEYQDNYFQLLPPNKGRGNFKIVCQSGQDAIVLCKIIPQNYAMEASMPIPGIKRLC